MSVFLPAHVFFLKFIFIFIFLSTVQKIFGGGDLRSSSVLGLVLLLCLLEFFILNVNSAKNACCFTPNINSP